MTEKAEEQEHEVPYKYLKCVLYVCHFSWTNHVNIFRRNWEKYFDIYIINVCFKDVTVVHIDLAEENLCNS